MRCLLKFSTTPTSSHLSGTDSYLITISPLSDESENEKGTRGGKGGERKGRIVGLVRYRRGLLLRINARARGNCRCCYRYRDNPFSPQSRKRLPRFSKILSVN